MGIEKPVFDDLLPMIRCEARGMELLNLASHLNSVAASERTRTALGQIQKTRQDTYNWQMGLPRLYETFVRIEGTSLNRWQKAWVELAKRPYEDRGMDLSEDDRKRLDEISHRLTELSNRFAFNLIESDRIWYHEVSATQLKDMPQSAQEALRSSGKRFNSSTGYAVDMLGPSAEAVLAYCSDRGLRELVWRQRNKRGTSEGPGGSEFDNVPLVLEIVALRKEMAALYGFDSYAEFALRHRMAEKPNTAIAMLLDLRVRTETSRQREFELLCEYANSLGLDRVHPWDQAYLSQRKSQDLFGFSAADVAQYFPAQQLVDGAIVLVEKLLGVKIEERCVSAWDSNVRFFEIWQGQELRGGVYMDLYARPGKRQGAWTRTQVPRLHDAPCLCALNMNVAPPSGGRPATLTHQQVVTLFHELGHVMHLIMGKSPYPGVDMSSVERDAIEVPSQWLERFAWNKDVLASISRHVDTGQRLPEEWIDKLINSRNLESGLSLARQINFGLWDFEIHSKHPPKNETQLWQRTAHIRRQTMLPAMPEGETDKLIASFGHLFSGAYAAGYYGYLWSDVLSADAFALCEGDINGSTTNCQKFSHEILSFGASRPFSESFRAFAGRDPNPEALLRERGLAAERRTARPT